MSLKHFRLITLNRDLSLGQCRLESTLWSLLLWTIGSGAIAWDVSLGNLLFGTLAWELSRGNCFLSTAAWFLGLGAQLGHFRLEVSAWNLALGETCGAAMITCHTITTLQLKLVT